MSDEKENEAKANWPMAIVYIVFLLVMGAVCLGCILGPRIIENVSK